MFNTKAFSLVELLIIILLLSITSAIVIPYAAGVVESQSQAAARIIATDLEYARMQAIASCKDVTVIFNRSEKTYSLSYQSGLLIHPITKKDYIVNLSAEHSLDEVRITSTFLSDTVKFDPTGAAIPDGKVTLQAGNEQYYVEVEGSTGNILVSN